MNQQTYKSLSQKSTFGLYHFFQKKNIYVDPENKKMRVFKMPRFVIPLIGATFGFALYLNLSVKERIISDRQISLPDTQKVLTENQQNLDQLLSNYEESQIKIGDANSE